MPNPNTQHISVTTLPTTSVTIFPTRATVTRDIPITLHPGRNSITLFSISPHADPRSIQLSGHHTGGIITDLTVSNHPTLSPHPTGDNVDTSDSSSSEDEETLWPAELKAATTCLRELERSKKSLLRQQARNARKTSFLTQSLDNAAQGRNRNGIEPLVESPHTLRAYDEQMILLAQELDTVEESLSELDTPLAKARRARKKLYNRFQTAQSAHFAAKAVRKLKRFDRRPDTRPSGECYRVSVVIEVDTLPASIPTAVATTAEVSANRPEGQSLRLSYVVTNVSWEPRYELDLDTTTGTGTLVYRAHFTNRTGETWRDASVTLSTAQGGFEGAWDSVPVLEAWRVGLAEKGTETTGLYSPQEMQGRKREASPPRKKQRRGFNMEPKRVLYSHRVEAAGFSPTSPLYSPTSPLYSPASPVFSPTAPAPDHDTAQACFFRNRFRSPLRTLTTTPTTHGTTTTYPLPTARTIPSSPHPRQHTLASLHLSSIPITRTAVPKLHEAVFLAANLKNTSPAPLLRGEVAVTLDRAFAGVTTLPACAPGESVEVPLGIDGRVAVTYRDPVRYAAVKHVGWVGEREEVVRYVRVCEVVGEVEGVVVVRDQVPVSEVEGVRVVVVNPVGLGAGEEEVGGEGWRCLMGTDGEVSWDVEVGKGGRRVLELEWEVRVAEGKGVVSV